MIADNVSYQALGALAGVDEVLAWIDANVAVLDAETVSANEALGRVTASGFDGDVAWPGTPIAACDGFALESSRTTGAGPYNPLSFGVDASTAGMPAAWRVNAGDALADSVDAVLRRDLAELRGDTLEVLASVAPGENVIAAGREVSPGRSIIDAGRVLRVQDIALLELAGVSALHVVRRPVVRLVCARDSQHEAAVRMLGAMLERHGCGRWLVDFPQGELRSFLDCLDARDVDAVIGLGGTGQGWNDHAVEALADVGEVAFHGIALHPGESTAVGRLGQRPVVLLPGLPLAAFVAADLVASRVVRRLAGRPAVPRRASSCGTLTRKVASRLGRLEICRVRCDGDIVEPVAVADGTTLATIVRADGYVAIPAASEGFAAGESVTVTLYDDY